MDKRQKLTYLDVIRGIGIILVLIGHSAPPAIVHKMIYGFHMPLFFIISGFLFKFNRNYGFSQHLANSFKRYVQVYFCLSGICLLLFIPNMLFFDKVDESQFGLRLMDFIISICYGFSNELMLPQSTPLWFLLCLFVSSILLYGILKVKKYSLRMAIFLLLSIITVLSFANESFAPPWYIDVAPIAACFMYIGYLIRKYSLLEKLNNYPFVTILMFVIGFILIGINSEMDLYIRKIGNIFLAYMGALCVSVALLLLVYRFVNRSFFLEYIGKNSIIFFGLNYIVNMYIDLMFQNSFVSHLSYYWCIKTICGLVTLFVVSYFWNKFKQMRQMIKSRTSTQEI